MALGVVGFTADLLTLNFQNHNKGAATVAGRARIRRARDCGSLSYEALAAIGACVILVTVVALTMRDKKPRFRFDSIPVPATAGKAASAATPAGVPSGSPGIAPAPAADLNALFVQGRAESPLIATADASAVPPFVTNTDYARPPVFREIRETELGQIYESAPKKDKRALGKVARLGGFGTPEAMAKSFGYPSVDQMLWNWDRTISASPQFQASNFGTNSLPPLPY